MEYIITGFRAVATASRMISMDSDSSGVMVEAWNSGRSADIGVYPQLGATNPSTDTIEKPASFVAGTTNWPTPVAPSKLRKVRCGEYC